MVNWVQNRLSRVHSVTLVSLVGNVGDMSATCRRHTRDVGIWPKSADVGDIWYSIFVSFLRFGVV